MGKFRKKPVEIEAFTIKSGECPQWFIDAIEKGNVIILPDKKGCYINTLEGQMHGEITDYIIKGVSGEIYPCKPDIFEKTYESVEV
ncbi:hypothetical protein [Anaerotignum sp.]|uniref:hypothetical protein n=1 Tax=Anaerotignum sp. TaxID=2039241 RepID=UPI0028A9D4E1|nr:hypothetical protein [Anaerotignum sp.]